MQKNKKIILIILCILLGISVFLIGKILMWHSTERKIDQNIKESNLPKILANGKELQAEQRTFLIEQSLRLNFNIKLRDHKIVDISLDNLDILSNDFFLGKDYVKKNDKEISFNLPFLIKPGMHTLVINFEENGKKIPVQYPFVLGFSTSFNDSIQKSEFFVIPDSTKALKPVSWLILDGKLKIDTGYASLGFLYSFSDVSTSFKFTPNGNHLNLVFYFLESQRSVVFGNGSNSRITLLRGNPSSEPAIDGQKINLVPGQTYKTKIVRNHSHYKVYLKKADDSEDFTENDLVLDYQDSLKTVIQDSLGFSIWDGSDGVTIDDLTVIPFENE